MNSLDKPNSRAHPFVAEGGEPYIPDPNRDPFVDGKYGRQ